MSKPNWIEWFMKPPPGKQQSGMPLARRRLHELCPGVPTILPEGRVSVEWYNLNSEMRDAG